MRVSRIRVVFQVLLHLVLLTHILAYYFLDWKAIGALDFQAFFHHLLGQGLVTAGALLTLVLFLGAFIFGRLFCSWGCHFAATQDLAAWILRHLGWKPPHVKTRFLHWAPYVLLCVVFLEPALRRVRRGGWELRVDFAALGPWDTLPGWFFSTVTFLVCGAGILLFLGTRGFCRFVCPYGAVFRWSDRFTPFRVRRVASCASQCGASGVHPCTAACPTAIDVHTEAQSLGKVVDVDCVRCHLCIEACPSGALAYTSRDVAVEVGDAPPQVAGAGPTAAAEQVAPPPAAAGRAAGDDCGRYAWPLWGEVVVVAVAALTYVAIDLVYGGHFLAATLALAEGFLAFTALRLIFRRGAGKTSSTALSIYGFPLRQGRSWTFLGITVVGAFVLSVFPVGHAGAFKWLKREGLRLDPANARGVGAPEHVAGAQTLQPEARRRLEQAAVYYRRALGHIPFSLETRRLLVSAYVRLGNRALALEAARELVRRAPQDPAARRLLDWVEQQARGWVAPTG